jgi:hypothetical protein
MSVNGRSFDRSASCAEVCSVIRDGVSTRKHSKVFIFADLVNQPYNLRLNVRTCEGLP